jgi:WD40 repeat protein
VTISIPTKNDLPTLVWRLLPTGNDQIVSGDSLGGVTLWDVKTCTVLQSRHDHQADVLAMAIRGSYLYSSGVDARVNNYKLESKKLNHLSTTGVLTRDVCAMVITEAGAIVGGADARLGVVQKSAHPKLDRFTQPGMCVVRHDRVFCQNGGTQIKVFTQSGEKAEYLANIDNKTDIACFALNDMGDTVLIAGIDGTIRSLTLNTEAKEINATEVTKVEGLVTSLAVNDRYSVVAVAGGSVSLMVKGKSAVTLPTSELKDIVTNIRLFGGNKVLLSTKNTLSVLTIDAMTKTTVSGTFKLESGVITSLSEKIEQQVVVTSSDHTVFILSSTDLKEKTQRKLPSKPSKFHHTKWVELDDKTMSLFAESFILTAELNEQSEIVSGFKFNSALPTGGAIVGVGKLESGEPAGKKSKKDDESVSKTVAIMASFKETSKALIVPFERKQFQK